MWLSENVILARVDSCNFEVGDVIQQRVTLTHFTRLYMEQNNAELKPWVNHFNQKKGWISFTKSCAYFRKINTAAVCLNHLKLPNRRIWRKKIGYFLFAYRKESWFSCLLNNFPKNFYIEWLVHSMKKKKLESHL